MRIIYDIVLLLFRTGIGIGSFFNNHKARLWTEGRRSWEEKISNSPAVIGKKRVWFHCASLGEFEQGRPLIEKLKSNDPSLFIILSFYSPSGYELRKNYSMADLVCYLPFDTKKNAERFISILSPSYVIFIKYEFWLHYFEELGRKKIPLYMVSVIFRPSQIFFRWYGTFYRNVLQNVKHFFVQDRNSASLLAEFGFKNITITGDTRFDRVSEVMRQENKNIILEKFKKDSRLFIAGSTWPLDENIFLPALKKIRISDLKIVIAPHEVSEKRILELIRNVSLYFNETEIVRYSMAGNPENARVLIIDNIGILSSVYGYGTVAWIGGGFGKGIHNILEAAAYGRPVIFGPNYKKFREAVDLTVLEGAFEVKSIREAAAKLNELFGDERKLEQSSHASSLYVKSQLGATDKILSMLPKSESRPSGNL